MSAQPALDELRRTFMDRGLRRADLAADPVEQLRRWYEEARTAGVHEPDAVVVSTVDAGGTPSSRYVLMRGLDQGVVFFTNYESRKGREIGADPVAALVFPWHVLSRQVRAVGRVERVSAEESDAYFASRPRGAQIGAWASPQSEPLADRAELEARTAEVENRFAGKDVPRPPHWGGFRVVPDEVEVWQGRVDRLHDRFVYRRDPSGPGGWSLTRLAP